MKGDKMYFIFNDTGEYLFLRPGMTVKQFGLKGKDALITLAMVDSEGNVSREALMPPEKRDAILKPKDCVQMRDDRLFIYAQRKKESRFGFITLDWIRKGHTHDRSSDQTLNDHRRTIP